MQRFLSPLIILILASQPVFSQEVRASLQSDLAQAYGYCTGQKLSIEKIQLEFPTLANGAARAQLAFELAFKPACDNIELELQAAAGTRWSNFKSQMHQKFKSQLSSTISQSQAEAFIKEVALRAKGNLESPVLQTLLSRHPDFQNSPVKEFISGFTNTFRPKDHPKAKGVDFQIQYPKSWLAKEGVRPNVIQLITSENGRGSEAVVLIVKEIPLPPNYKVTQAELDDLFSVQGMKEMIPQGSTVLGAQPITLDRQKGAMIKFDTSTQRVDVMIFTRNLHFVTLYGNKMIFIQCMSHSMSPDKQALQARFDKFEPLFKLIANSFVLQSQY